MMDVDVDADGYLSGDVPGDVDIDDGVSIDGRSINTNNTILLHGKPPQTKEQNPEDQTIYSGTFH